jgi:hypothetical protein
MKWADRANPFKKCFQNKTGRLKGGLFHQLAINPRFRAPG